jgi:hypothetical protein
MENIRVRSWFVSWFVKGDAKGPREKERGEKKALALSFFFFPSFFPPLSFSFFFF